MRPYIPDNSLCRNERTRGSRVGQMCGPQKESIEERIPAVDEREGLKEIL